MLILFVFLSLFLISGPLESGAGGQSFHQISFEGEEKPFSLNGRSKKDKILLLNDPLAHHFFRPSYGSAFSHEHATSGLKRGTDDSKLALSSKKFPRLLLRVISIVLFLEIY